MEFSAINHLLRLGKIYVCGCPVLICSICSWMFGLLLDLSGNRPINADVHTYCMMNILLEQGRAPNSQSQLDCYYLEYNIAHLFSKLGARNP